MVCVEHGRDDERDWEEEGMWATSGEESEGIPVISRASKPSCGLALLRRGSVANLRSAPARVSSLRAGGPVLTRSGRLVLPAVISSRADVDARGGI
jgi:hypothetical protein